MADKTKADIAPKKEPRTGRRRLWLIGGMLAAFVIYAFGFQVTDVDLAEIRDETRREQLVRIMRALAHPDLVTYENIDTVVGADILVPCAPDGPEPAPPDQSGPYLELPACAEPESSITVRGFGFDADSEVDLVFIPDSEFAVTLTLGEFLAGADGAFEATIEIPARASENLQQIEAVTAIQVGSWFDRVEVSSDLNDNGFDDPDTMPASGSHQLFIPQLERVEGAGIGVQIGNDVVQFIATGEEFTATNGPATGLPAGSVTGEDAIVTISSVDAGGMVTLAAAAGTNLTDAKVLVYDPIDGQLAKAIRVADETLLSPRLSENALDTWDKIIETVFLALLATTVGTFLAVPISFMAARNLMRDISTTVINLALNLLAVPVGAVLGVLLAGWGRSIADPINDSAFLILLGLVVLPPVIWFLARRALPTEDLDVPTRQERLGRAGLLVVAAFGGVLFLNLLSEGAMRTGTQIEDPLGAFGFLGRFVFTSGEILGALITLLVIIGSVGVLMNLASRLGYSLRSRLPAATVRALGYPLTALAFATVGAGVGWIVNWFYEFETNIWLWVPVTVGALWGLWVVWRNRGTESINTGLTVYYASRTLFNTLRSIEPLVMVIVFVVWVGFGPFAGSLALALHTTAALAKLYSEQVESISVGPLEAVRATGATRLQTVVYAVVPQIVPPYISFTMYRWDINVRMSTIIGFAGGGGIGFLLQQNINLLQYRAAAAQMLAIAIVVASMDYISSRLRERFV